MNKLFFHSPRLLPLLLLLCGIIASAQTEEQTKKITSTYNKAYLKNLAAQSLEKSIKEKKEAIEFARARNLPLSYTTKDSSYSELQRVLPDGTLIYYQRDNKDAAISTRVNHLYTGGSTGYNLDGQNMYGYVWDEGHPRVTHQEFDGTGGNDRVTIMDADQEGGVILSRHGTHVIGTIAASGFVPEARGMAPQGKVKAYKWNNDLAEATSAVLEGMLLSNHSYGPQANSLSANIFGAYGYASRDWDNLMFHAPYYLMVKSAGNLGSNDSVNRNPLFANYDKLVGFGTAKNNLVVASAEDAVVDIYGNLSEEPVMAGNSSQGPTDDLRIKPDITGNGVEVYSTDSTSGYRYLSGTSMATPNVMGSLMLLQQHYNNENGGFMRAATLKGLALHTADNIGVEGPDAVSGWGLLNAKRAAETISNNGSSSSIQELVISEGQTITLTVESDGLQDLMASISWTDRAGRANEVLNSGIPALVNDLDIRVEKENDATIFYPWRLISATENSNDGSNIKDPFERVDVKNASGNYIITITHKGTLVGGSQAFSLIVTGIESIGCSASSVPENIQIVEITGTRANIVWDVIQNSFFELRYRRANTQEWIEIQDLVSNNYEIRNLHPLTAYELQVGAKCSEGDNTRYSETISFSTGTISYCESFSEDEEFTFFISKVNLNTIDNNSEQTGYSDFTYLGTELVAGNTYEVSITGTADLNYRTSYSVWIDYNKDGYFEGTEELVFSATTAANTPTIGSFTIPDDVGEISTRMRVSLTADTLPPRPCDIFVNGEVEDYTIHLRLPTDFIYEDGIWSPMDPAGNCTKMDNIRVVNGTAIFGADISAKNIEIDEGATLNVEKVLTLAGDLTNNGNLVFLSGPTGNGELAFVPPGSSITGNATVQRYMGNRRAYRMVSSAVTTTSSIHQNWQEGAISNTDDPHPGFGTHITGSTVDQHNGFDGTLTGNPSMYTVNVETQQFMVQPNTDQLNLEAGYPYLMYVRGDRSINLGNNQAFGETVLRATGALYYGPHTTDFVNSTAGDFVMFGNPYQSAVDITSVLANSTNVNPNYYYIYDPYNATHGNYITVDLSIPSPLQYLQPGQAAQVEVLGPATVRFNESDKSPGNFTGIHRPAGSGSDKLLMEMYTTENYNNGGPLHDRFVIRFAEAYDNELTLADAVKPMNFYENLGIDHEGTLLSLEKRNMPDAGELYQLYNSGYQYSEYTFKLIVEGLEEVSLYLEDRFEGVSTLLSQGENIYSFNVSSSNSMSMASDRFLIRTATRLGVEDNALLSGISLYPNPLNGEIFHINAPGLQGKEVEVIITDLSGRRFYREKFQSQSSNLTVKMNRDLSSGVYLVTVKSGEEMEVLKLIRK